MNKYPINYYKDKYCSDCGRRVSDAATRCHSCAMKNNFKLGLINIKGKRNHFYKDGIKTKQHFCIVCNAPISYYAVKYGKHKCRRHS